MTVEEFRQELKRLNDEVINFEVMKGKEIGGFASSIIRTKTGKNKSNLTKQQYRNVSGWSKHGWL
tara:strand:- start:2708 stop:2902 length:195 start_codon:yes stop_codon:yes gene_type:complete